MKPFNLEAAKQGAPVITRDGYDARIVCFDRRGGSNLVVLIDVGGVEQVHTTHIDGAYLANGNNSPYDLFMKPTKKKGWVNIYKGYTKPYMTNIFESREEAEQKRNKDAICTTEIEWEE